MLPAAAPDDDRSDLPRGSAPSDLHTSITHQEDVMPVPFPRRRRAFVVASMLAILAPLGADAQLTCGGTVGPGGTFVMTADISNCAAGTALTVVGPAKLEMNAHRIHCAGGLQTGLRLEGRGVKVRSGSASGCTVGVAVGGEGGHGIRDVLATTNTIGFGVASDGNLLAGNSASLNASHAFQIVGSRNKLVGNVANDNASATSFESTGDGNAFSRNLASESNFSFRTGSATSRNTFKDNVATQTGIGFAIDGARHLVSANTAAGSGTGFLLGAGNGGHVVQKNLATGAGGNLNEGFVLETDGNTLKGNHARNHGLGIVVSSRNNTLSGNQAVDNGLDIQDDNADCDNNVWKKNVFASATPPCVQ